MYEKSKIIKYLDKIQVNNQDVSIENLKMLQYSHLQHIPYENLDLMNGTPIKLDADTLYEKIIHGDRGGYCFELQGLFCCLLKSLGYSVEQYAGRFMDVPDVVQMRRHRILVVTLNDKRYVTDVGVRTESPRYPLLLQEDIIQNDGISEYKYVKDPFYGWVLMQRLHGKEWKTLLGFTEEPQIDLDYVMPSFYCEKHADSTFNKYMKVSIFTDEANLNVVGNEFRIFKNGKIAERKVISNECDASLILWEYFRIKKPEGYYLLAR